jgi:hypothetical protein
MWVGLTVRPHVHEATSRTSEAEQLFVFPVQETH